MVTSDSGHNSAQQSGRRRYFSDGFGSRLNETVRVKKGLTYGAGGGFGADRFVGAFGVHNFYAGYVKRGTIQLCVTLLTCFYGALASLVWAIIEICVVNQDADGTQFV